SVIRPALPLFLVGCVGQVLLGALTYLLPVVLGGGPKAIRGTTTLLGRGWPLRLTAPNLGLPLTLLPGLPGTLAWAAVLASGLTFIVLAVTAVLRAWEGEFSPAHLGIGLGVVLTALALIFAFSGHGNDGATVTQTGQTHTDEVALGDMVSEPSNVTVDRGDEHICAESDTDNHTRAL